MATYKDDLDIIKAAESDNKSMTLNAITELDNKGLLGKYGGEGGGSFEKANVMITNSSGKNVDISYIKICGEIQVPRPFHKAMGQSIDSISGILVGSVIVIEDDAVEINESSIEGSVEVVTDPWGIYSLAVLVKGTGRFTITNNNDVVS